MTSNLSRVDPARKAALRALLVASANTSAPTASSPSPTRERRSTRRRVVVGLVSAAAVTATAAAMLAGDPTAPASYASWTAAPAAQSTPATVQDDGTWERVKDFFGVESIQSQASQCEDLTGGSVGIEGVPRRERDAAQRSVLVDRRGDWTFCVDVIKGTGTATDPLVVMDGLESQKPLPADDNGVSVVSSNGATVWDKPYTWPTGPQVSVLGGSPFVTPGEEAARTNFSLIGAAGPNVREVSINLADGTVITTTLHGDFWAAWWPGLVTTARVDTLTVTTGTGERYDVDPRTIGLPWEQYGGSVTPWP